MAATTEKTPLADMVRKAATAEEAGRMEEALGIYSDIGARVIGGEAVPEEASQSFPTHDGGAPGRHRSHLRPPRSGTTATR